MTEEKTRIAVAGLGTVGGSLLNLLQQRDRIEVVAVSARERKKKRTCKTEGILWYDDAVDMAREAEVDLVVELIGGEDGVALECARAALQRGKNLVTANKALLARHGAEISRLAEEKGCAVGWEAAVAAAVPVVAAVRQSLRANRTQRITGIVNGTCNYILSRLETHGEDFATALRTAQEKGYAEADPRADMQGYDSAQKIALLAALAFTTPPAIDEVSVEGIERISIDDVNFAKRRGYAIRLLALAERIEDKLSLRVHPTLVRLGSSFASVSGVHNAILYQGDFSGQIFLKGQGAGAEATASAVAGDIFDIGSGRKSPLFGMPNKSLNPLPFFPLDDIVSPWYLHFRVQDKVGVVATIAALLSECNISLSAILQDDTLKDDTLQDDALQDDIGATQERTPRPVSLLLWTHRASTRAVAQALRLIEKTSLLQERTVALRILDDRQEDREGA